MSGQPPNPGSLGSPPRPGSPLVVDNRHPGVTNPSPTEAITPVPAGKPCKYPPYPPYSPEPQLVSLMDTITGGKTIRYQYKSSPPQPRSPPKPAQPKGPKVTDVRMSRREYRAHARCIKRNSPVLTERLEKISRPTRRQIIYMWRDRADVLPAETIARFRTMLDADEPIKPDQAYQHFRNVKKSRKKKKPSQVLKAKKKKKMDIYGDKKCEWARNATITLARSLQQRLSRPGSYNLQDGMLNLSNVVMCEIAKYLHMKPVHRQCPCPKAKFLMELSDKIAVWIDEVMLESDERMLMMDADEDDELMEYFGSASMAKEAGDAKPGPSKILPSEQQEALTKVEDDPNYMLVVVPPQSPPPQSPPPQFPMQQSPLPQSPPLQSQLPQSPPQQSPPPQAQPPQAQAPQSPPSQSPPPQSPPPQ